MFLDRLVLDIFNEYKIDIDKENEFRVFVMVIIKFLIGIKLVMLILKLFSFFFCDL